MQGICPNCEDYRELESIKGREVIKVRGEPIEVETNYFRCSFCGEDFGDPRSKADPIDIAFREYRKKHGMTQPEEIRGLRKQFGLTQTEMSKILGWGLATLSRYENGALQDEAHDVTLRLVKDPLNLLRLIQQNPGALPDDKRDILLRQLTDEFHCTSWERALEEWLQSLGADIYSGYKTFNYPKLSAAILFFCKDGALTTVINKLLFYADFKHFKEYTVSITGSRYLPIKYGPVPDKWKHFLAFLTEKGELDVDEVFCSENISGEKYTSRKAPDLSVFTDTELKILASTKEHLGRLTATKISDYSHQEKAYIETPYPKYITYEFAKDLRF